MIPETKPPIVTPTCLMLMSRLRWRVVGAPRTITFVGGVISPYARPTAPTPTRKNAAPGANAARTQPQPTAATEAASMGGAPKRSVSRPDGTAVMAAPPNTIAVIAPICQRVSERSERISGASGAKPSVAYEPAAIDSAHMRHGPGAAGRARARSGADSHGPKV